MIEWRSSDDPEQPLRDGDKAVTEPVQRDESKVREKVTTNPDASDDAKQPLRDGDKAVTETVAVPIEP